MSIGVTTVVVPADGSTVVLDPGTTIYSALVLNSGTVRIYAAGFVGEHILPNPDGGGPEALQGSMLGAGASRTIYPKASTPILAWTDTGSAGQVTVTAFPR